MRLCLYKDGNSISHMLMFNDKQEQILDYERGGYHFSLLAMNSAARFSCLQLNDQSKSFGLCGVQQNWNLELFLLMMAKCNNNI